MTGDWAESYACLVDRLADWVRRSRLTLCGFSACVDVYLSLHDVLDEVAEAAKGTPAAAMIAELKRRARAGIGGELHVDWPQGPAWMARHFQGRLGLGGTSAQAANLLATLGAPALLSLAGRDRDQLSVIHPDVYLATDRGPITRNRIASAGSGSAPHYIFEFTAGRTIDGEVLRR